ncbi:hypothetical protein NQ317_003814 [Molorchus minor]|uniref:Major facilitator superfamily (MFS) profile domain-containing protein n=1 Tax=Molorchus minor TaxID=1323400 RepID=A0ABQ9JGA5_9CUCU|nr:hypothetical protein NQ317_003814 [Molorchus minor]
MHNLFPGNLASFVCGTTFGWTSPEIPKLKLTVDNPLAVPLTASEEGWVGSLLPLGAAIGPFMAGIAADKFGRKKTLLVASVPFILAFVLNILASDVKYFFASRFLCGLAVGSVFTVIPMYIGEIADDEVRGSLADQREAAEKSLSKLRGKPINDIQKELEAIRSTVEEALANKASFFDIFKSRGLKMALFLSVGLVAMQQFSGINIILFYTQDIFTDAGVSLPPEICTIAIGVVQILASAATPVLVDRKGKRFLLLLSAVGMGLSQAVIAYFFYLKDDKHSDISAIGWIPIVSLIVYIVTYCLGFGPLPWAVMGELFPGNIKSVASTVTASGCWVLGFLLTNYFGMVTGLIGKSGSFGIFSVCCVIATVFTYKLVPETSGKSLQEIQDILNGNTNDKD